MLERPVMSNIPGTRPSSAGPRQFLGLMAATLLTLTLVTCRSNQLPPTHNTLTVEEKAYGWRLLFDGRTFNGWRGLGRKEVPAEHWVIDNGAIKKLDSGEIPVQADGQPLEGGDLMTVESFDNFEMVFEWRISPGGNSGVKYNVSEELSTRGGPSHAALGFEYQILDDAEHPDGADPDHRTAALYDLIAPGDNKQLRPVGEFNQSRIIFNGHHAEHWLNGAKVVAFDLGTPGMDEALAASKYKDIAGFGDRREGHIVLQDHGDAVWYRNLKIRVLPPGQ